MKKLSKGKHRLLLVVVALAATGALSGGLALAASSESPLQAAESANQPVTQVSQADLQNLIDAARSQPDLPVTASERARLAGFGTTLKPSDATVDDYLIMAQLIRDDQGVGSTNPVPQGETVTPPPDASAARVKHHARGRLRRGLAHAAASCLYLQEDGFENVKHYSPFGGHDYYVYAEFTGLTDQYNCTTPTISAVGNWYLGSGFQAAGLCHSSPDQSYHGGDGTWYNTPTGAHSTWIHGMQVTYVGLYDGGTGGCLQASQKTSAVRGAVNDYRDCYNDFGFAGNYGCGDTYTIGGPFK